LALGARYLGIVIAVFGVVNLPFIVWQPEAWAHGTLIPFVDPLVADGQGLVSLATHGITGGVNLSVLGYAAALAYLTILAAYVIWYGQLKRVWLLLLPIAFFFSARSLANYLVDLVPVAVVAMATVRSTTNDSPAFSLPRIRGRRLWPALPVVLPALGVVIASALAFSSPPLQLSVKAVHRSEFGGFIGSVTVSVHNQTNSSLTPYFLVDTGDAHPSGFWFTPTGKPVIVAPHASTTVILRPPVDVDQPGLGSHWLVEAYTAHPNSLSSSPLQEWMGWIPRP
jgi:hypothetical protein